MAALDTEERERRERLIRANTGGGIKKIAKKLRERYACSSEIEPSAPGIVLTFEPLGSPRGEPIRIYAAFNYRDMSLLHVRGNYEPMPPRGPGGKADEAWVKRMNEMKEIGELVGRVFYDEGLIKTPPPVADGVMRQAAIAEGRALAEGLKGLTACLAERLPEGAALSKIVVEHDLKGLSWYFTHSKFGHLGFITLKFSASAEVVAAILGEPDDTPGDEDAALFDDGSDDDYDDDGGLNITTERGTCDFSLLNRYSGKDDGYMKDRRDLMGEIGEMVSGVLDERTGYALRHLQKLGAPQRSVEMASDFYDDPQVIRQGEHKKIPIEKVAEAERAIMARLSEERARMARGLSGIPGIAGWVRADASVHVQENRVTLQFIHDTMGELGRADIGLDDPGTEMTTVRCSVRGFGDGRDPERGELMREIAAAVREAFGAAGS
jgi:hypothetical protein